MKPEVKIKVIYLIYDFLHLFSLRKKASSIAEKLKIICKYNIIN